MDMREGTNFMNHNERAYFLSYVYDPLLMTLNNGKTGSQMKMCQSEEVCCPFG